MRLTRRDFIGSLVGGAVGSFATRAIGAQDAPALQEMTGPMDESAHRPVRLPAKGMRPSMTNDERDALERKLGCRCGCGLDVFICRTTHFTCAVSPAMHRDVMALLDGGHSAQEIIDAFTGVYGERVLMLPRKAGFNLAGYLMPFVVLAGGTALVLGIIRRWRHSEPVTASVASLPLEATPQELARLEAAVRNDER